MKRILGIEIGNKTIKLVEADKKGIHKLKIVDTPENAILNDQLVAFDAVGDLLKDACKEARFSTRNCAVVLPDDSVSIKKLTVPFMDHKQLLLNLSYEFRDVINDDKDDYAFDYRTIKVNYDEDNKPKEILLYALAVEKELVEKYKEMCSRAGLKLVSALPHEFSVTGLVKSVADEVNHKDLAILDLGHMTTKLYFFEKDEFEVARTLDRGLKTVIDSYADNQMISSQLACINFQDNKDNIQEADIAVDLYSMVAADVMRSLNYYNFEKPDNELETVYYCGGGAFVNRYITEIKETIPVELKSLNGLLQDENTDLLKCATAYGLCLEVLNGNKKKDKKKPPLNKYEINIVDHTKEDRKRIAILSFSIFIPILTAFVIFGVVRPMLSLAEKEAQYRSYEDSLNKLNKELEDFAEINSEYNKVVGSFLETKELALKDRIEIIDMIKEDIIYTLDITDISIIDNSITIITGPSDMTTISSVLTTLLEDERNSFVTMKTTAVNSKNSNDLVATFQIIYVGGSNDAE